MTIPDSVTTIGYDAFLQCSALADLTIGSHVQSICSSAFARCSSLENVEIPSSVTDIDHYAFVDTRYGSVVRIDRSRSIVIIGEKDSYAKQFAIGRGIAFKAKRLRK